MREIWSWLDVRPAVEWVLIIGAAFVVALALQLLADWREGRRE